MSDEIKIDAGVNLDIGANLDLDLPAANSDSQIELDASLGQEHEHEHEHEHKHKHKHHHLEENGAEAASVTIGVEDGNNRGLDVREKMLEDEKIDISSPQVDEVARTKEVKVDNVDDISFGLGGAGVEVKVNKADVIAPKADVKVENSAIGTPKADVKVEKVEVSGAKAEVKVEKVDVKDKVQVLVSEPAFSERAVDIDTTDSKKKEEIKVKDSSIGLEKSASLSVSVSADKRTDIDADRNKRDRDDAAKNKTVIDKYVADPPAEQSSGLCCIVM